ncbi:MULTISPECIES: radical SAM/SPASM domain-containing protein [Acidiplasma]|jgi:uncharacterized protein|uniref:Radical SAM protein n=2 Tax=Acidiplasma TaxID=507753 RepID=A0A0Q0VQ77_9ARCH|nr:MULTISPECIES: radical SAM protein [Acidiplasma]KJE48920.1 radical SAM protein [Acidiplasma sp. MBA-1]KPV46663.1 radical SAM protein [Acidiplasma aeolicum]KQB35191.1 radical SAM protein [Acidiplasma aeolicum]KQB35945.1 radical SAM protein [Acidiplasma cupricumulans]WMT54336.1 MAG: SPASM domain-containing protein [Acidiplasma sp.]
MPQQFFSKYNVFIRDGSEFILFNTLTGYAIKVSSEEKEKITSGIIPEDIKEVFYEGFITDDINAEFDKLTLKKNILEPTMVLTYNCNFDCSYCFQKDFRNKSRVNDNIINGFVNYINKNSNGRKVRVTFFGGEPLLEANTIKKVSSMLGNLNYEFSIVTNGSMLTKNMADDLYGYGLRYAQITLDGPREVHDSRRYFVNRRGSFDIILKNLLYVQDLLNVVLRINIDYSNIDDFDELLYELKNMGIENIRIDPHLVHENLFRNEAWDENISRQDEFDAVQRIWHKIKLHGFRVPQDIFRLGVCVAHVDEDIIVDPAGYIYPCWAFTGNTKFAKGLLKSDGSVEIINRALLAKNASLAWKNDECKNCSYLPLCFGGCRFFSVLDGKSFSSKECRKETYKKAVDFIKDFI